MKSKLNHTYRAAWVLKLQGNSFRDIRLLLQLDPVSVRKAVKKGRTLAGKVGVWVSGRMAEQGREGAGEKEFPEKVVRHSWVRLEGTDVSVCAYCKAATRFARGMERGMCF